MAQQNLMSPATGVVPAVLLAEVSDPKSSVVALPSRGRPKLRKYANSHVARDLALMPSVTRDAPVARKRQSRPALRRSQSRPSPFVAYLSTIGVAVALGSALGLVIINGGLPVSESFAQLLLQIGAKAP